MALQLKAPAAFREDVPCGEHQRAWTSSGLPQVLNKFGSPHLQKSNGGLPEDPGSIASTLQGNSQFSLLSVPGVLRPSGSRGHRTL